MFSASIILADCSKAERRFSRAEYSPAKDTSKAISLSPCCSLEDETPNLPTLVNTKPFWAAVSLVKLNRDGKKGLTGIGESTLAISSLYWSNSSATFLTLAK